MGTEGLTEVLAVVERLTPEEKLQLIEYLAHNLQQTPPPRPSLSWKDACGLGKHLWQHIDVDRYVDDLRNEWDC